MALEDGGVWFPVIKANTGVDRFTERLVAALQERNITAEASWLPISAEFAPWLVTVPTPPAWASVVHVNASLPIRFIPRHIPCVATFHSFTHCKDLLEFKSLPQRLYHKFWVQWCERRVIGRADVLTAVSRYASQSNQVFFETRAPIPVNNWINTSLFKPAEYAEPGLPFKLLYVGKINRLKGADLLPRIMKQLGQDYELSYTGCAAEIEALGERPSSNMHGIGKIFDTNVLIEKYQESDALLFPTRTEGFGLVALEAQACGLPVVSRLSSSLPEIVKNNVSGFLCGPSEAGEEEEGFVTAIQKLKNPGLHRKMSISARKWALENFSEEAAIEKYLKIYQSLL